MQAVCPNGGTSGVSSPYAYATPTPLAPPGLAFNKAYPYTVTWNAVPGAIAYFYQNGSAPITVNVPFIADPLAELTNGQSYEVSVAAIYPCAVGPYSSSILVTVPPLCSTAPEISEEEGGTYITLDAVAGAASYNVGWENASYDLVYEVQNIGPVITTSGYNFTGVPSGSYYIVAQTNCTNGGTSVWGSPYYGGLITIESAKAPLDSLNPGLALTNSTADSLAGMSVYPNPSRWQANIIYNTPVTGQADLTVTTEFGNTVMHKAVNTVAGQNSFTLNIGQLANGIYFIRLTDGKNIRYQKLVVAK